MCPYDTVKTESDEYDLGEEVVVQEGQLGLQEVVQDVTYINGVASDVSIVDIITIQDPVPEQVIVGTHVENSLIAQVGQRHLLLAGAGLPLRQPLG